MKFNTIHQQKGIGLIEVLVALLILAVAILGFSAMQMNAIRTTDESGLRSRAMTVMRGGAEIMRANSAAIEPFVKKLNDLNTAGSAINNGVATTCVNKECTATQLAERDAQALYNYALTNEVNINAAACPGTTGAQAKQCLIVSWNTTTADMKGTTNSCANADGTYRSAADCIIVESY